MASLVNFLLSFFWPSNFSNDLSVSNRLVHSLPLQPSTKYFTLALRDPHHPSSVLYILSTLPLSEQSGSDARDLINIVKPSAVVVHVGPDATEVTEHLHPSSLNNLDIYPKSVLHVIKEGFHDGNNHAKYMKMAQDDVIKAIFGTTIMGHIVASKQAAEESKSSFYYLESPREDVLSEESCDDKNDPPGTARHVASSLGSSLFSQLGGAGSCKVNLDSPGLKFIASHLTSSLDNALAAAPSSAGLSAQVHEDNRDTEMEYKCPEFAQPFYSFLTDLYNTYRHLPGMALALQMTQKLLMDVEKGKGVDNSELAVCQCFRLAAEGLRVALNSSARAPLTRENVASSMLEFDELPYEEKCHVLLAQALKQQLQKSQCVVAVLDAHMVAGIRKYWMTPFTDDVTALALDCLISESDEDASKETEGSRGRILDKPIIVVGAGAAAAVGVASLSQWAPVSTAMKILSFKIPTIVKLGMLQTKKGAVAAMAKAANPVINLFVPSGKGVLAAKSTMASKVSVLKAVASTGNVRAAAHSVIATAEKASLSAIRTAFYNAMRNRHRKGVGGRLWLSFGASVAACAGLLTFGDGIENVIEVIPEAYSIVQLCQGVNNLCHASNALKKVEHARYWEAMYSRLYKECKHSR